jgi:hypothetical protein
MLLILLLIILNILLLTIMKGKIVHLINNHTNECQLEMFPTNGDYSGMTREVNNCFDLITTSLS